MTCIVGLVTDKGVLIGGDSAGVSEYNLIVRSDPKVFTTGPFLIGFTYSFRVGQLLRYRLTVPEQQDGVDDFAYMATEFVDAVRACLHAHGAMKDEQGVHQGGVFLVGYRGQLYRVDSDFQIGVNACGFDAVGCGDQVALGALAALEGSPPKKRIERALQIAEQFNAGVRGPFTVEAI